MPGESLSAKASPLIAVVGPTGAGKSELGLVLAKVVFGEIVNCDSIQVYRQLDIGSAKLPPEKRQNVRHHLVDLIDVNEELTAGAYSRLARGAVLTITKTGHVPVVVGGTGFYLRALLEGLVPAPTRDEDLRRRLVALAGRRPLALHRFLRQHDPQAADRIHCNDHQKLIRAIELTIIARQPASKTQSLARVPFEGIETLKIGLRPERSSLCRKLDERSAWMFHNGLLEETKALLDRGLPPDSKPLQSLGYKQAVRVLTGACSIQDAIADCQVKTRQYAKRQMTWFRREPGVIWLDGFGSEKSIQKQALELSQQFLERFQSTS